MMDFKMTDFNITEEAGPPNWRLSAPQWDAVVRRAQAGPDALADGAFVRADAPGAAEIRFYATARNKPLGWGYPFLEDIPGSRTRGALIGYARREAETDRIEFEVALPAAASAIAADYESGASDLDFVTYEQAVQEAVLGTPSDLAWLHAEFGRLAVLSVE